MAQGMVDMMAVKNEGLDNIETRTPQSTTPHQLPPMVRGGIEEARSPQLGEGASEARNFAASQEVDAGVGLSPCRNFLGPLWRFDILYPGALRQLYRVC
jgi:hypothetical protein